MRARTALALALNSLGLRKEGAGWSLVASEGFERAPGPVEVLRQAGLAARLGVPGGKNGHNEKKRVRFHYALPLSPGDACGIHAWHAILEGLIWNDGMAHSFPPPPSPLSPPPP